MKSQASQEDLRTLARGGVLNFLGAVAYAAFTFLFALVVGRGLGPAEAGVLFEAIALLTVLSAVALLGADTGIVRAIARALTFERATEIRANLTVALLPVAAMSCALGAALVLFAPEISRAIVHGVDEDAAVPYLRVFGAVLPLMALTRLMLSATRGLGANLPFVAIENFLKGGLRLLLAVAAIGMGLGATGLALATWGIPVAVSFVLAVWMLIALVRRTERRANGGPPEPATAGLARSFWQFSGIYGVATSVQTSIVWLDIILVGALASAHDAGVYAAATRYVALGIVALQAIILVLGPQFSSLVAAGERDRLRIVYQTATCWLTAVSWPFFLLLVIFAPVFVGVFGSGFGSGETVLQVLGLATLVSLVAGPVGLIVLMEGRSKRNLANTCVSAVTNIGLNILLIPRYGIEGAAVAVAASIVVGRAMSFAQAWFLTRLNPFTPQLALVAAGSALCYGALGLGVRAAFGTSPAALAFTILLGTVLYVGVLWRFRSMLELSALVRVALRPRSAPGISEFAS